MKIGLSYSRCIRDIVEGKVDINDVLVIISRTDLIRMMTSNGKTFGKVTAAVKLLVIRTVIPNGWIILPKMRVNFGA